MKSIDDNSDRKSSKLSKPAARLTAQDHLNNWNDTDKAVTFEQYLIDIGHVEHPLFPKKGFERFIAKNLCKHFTEPVTIHNIDDIIQSVSFTALKDIIEKYAQSLDEDYWHQHEKDFFESHQIDPEDYKKLREYRGMKKEQLAGTGGDFEQWFTANCERFNSVYTIKVIDVISNVTDSRYFTKEELRTLWYNMRKDTNLIALHAEWNKMPAGSNTFDNFLEAKGILPIDSSGTSNAPTFILTEDQKSELKKHFNIEAKVPTDEPDFKLPILSFKAWLNNYVLPERLNEATFMANLSVNGWHDVTQCYGQYCIYMAGAGNITGRVPYSSFLAKLKDDIKNSASSIFIPEPEPEKNPKHPFVFGVERWLEERVLPEGLPYLESLEKLSPTAILYLMEQYGTYIMKTLGNEKYGYAWIRKFIAQELEKVEAGKVAKRTLPEQLQLMSDNITKVIEEYFEERGEVNSPDMCQDLVSNVRNVYNKTWWILSDELGGDDSVKFTTQSPIQKAVERIAELRSQNDAAEAKQNASVNRDHFTSLGVDVANGPDRSITTLWVGDEMLTDDFKRWVGKNYEPVHNKEGWFKHRLTEGHSFNVYSLEGLIILYEEHQKDKEATDKKGESKLGREADAWREPIFTPEHKEIILPDMHTALLAILQHIYEHGGFGNHRMPGLKQWLADRGLIA